MADGEDDHEISYIEDSGQVKFYLRRPVHLYVPTAIKDDGYDPLLETSPPSQSLELQYIYGYKGRTCRNNVVALASGEVVYFTAAVGVVYNVDDNTQRFYNQHTDDIRSLAVHPDGETVATGQVKGNDDEFDAAHVRVWSSVTLETLHVFGTGEVERAVACLAFSVTDGGGLLAVVDEATEPRLSVWEWQDENKVAAARCSGDPVLAVTFSRESTQRVVTSGKNSLVFWSLEDGALKKRTAVYGSHPKPKFTTAVAFTESGQTITGDNNGNIFFWKEDGSEVTKAVTGIHEGSVFFILPHEGGFLTSGKDGTIKKWDVNFGEASASVVVSENDGAARAFAVLGEQLVVGTIKNCLLKGSLADGFTTIFKGAEEELWAVATHPSSSQFLTGCLGGLLIARDAETKETQWFVSMKSGVQSVCYSPGGEVVVVGLADGTWQVLDTETQEVVFEGHDGDEPIQVVRFSPDGSLLALGSRDNSVYIYEAGDAFKEYNSRGACTGHSSFIRSLDFSADGSFLRTNSGDYELLFWRTEDCSQETSASELRDTEWATRTCLLCFENFGVWPEGVDGTDLNSVTAAHQKPIVVTADDFGKIKLFKSQTYYAYTSHKVCRGHSSHATSTAFSHDDSFLVSLGGGDSSVLQWRVVDE
ncbi:echinoderm microtubule-associated protein-like 2 isoform X2 [Hyalella azteca]|uniref:Echinoderm microtubule-associated protein-like 2 isoform X2 n=1 Tax=Hyalella azteca TaxID=294128 RepID=A0A8B7P5U0_HYAAZ|nr:echinoderm microtubule-associated protein-like 2 isoform X2 [Hyalella azteca]